MKHYLLLFLSTLLLLFILPDKASVSSRSGMEQGVLKKACSHKKKVKRTCARKCLQHQTHGDQKNAAGTVTDCSAQSYALVAVQESPVFMRFALQDAGFATPSNKYLAPYLGREPDPPRFS